MTESKEFALIVAYYLSRCDKEAWTRLGYTSSRQGFTELGKILNVNPTTLRYRRDEFDAYNDNGRVGWLRPITGARANVMRAFQDTDDDSLFHIVKEILEDKESNKSEELEEISAVISEPKGKRDIEFTYAPRGKTGRRAEAFFEEYYRRTSTPVAGELVDRRDDGCGYDFEIKTVAGESHFVEVKGLAENDGGIVFTNKEWELAHEAGNRYYLVIVRNVSTAPEIQFVRDPASHLSPHKNIYTSIQVSWSVPGAALRSVGDK